MGLGLDLELIRKARELYKWEIYFQGDVESNPDKVFTLKIDSVRETAPLIESVNWLYNRRSPIIGIDSYPVKEGWISYGFVDLGSGRMQPYLPFAEVFPGRAEDYQQELLYAALLRLRRMISSKPASIRFPEFLADAVGLEHLCMLEPENLAIRKYQPRIAVISSDSEIDTKIILDHGKNALLPRQAS